MYDQSRERDPECVNLKRFHEEPCIKATVYEKAYALTLRKDFFKVTVLHFFLACIIFFFNTFSSDTKQIRLPWIDLFYIFLFVLVFSIVSPRHFLGG